MAVPLTAAGQTALQAGAVVRVDLAPADPLLEDPGGYRTFMRAA